MHALSLYLPNWATDRLQRRSPRNARRPVLLTTIDHERTIVAACCPMARARGVRPGMPLADARALLPGAPLVEDLSPGDDRRDLLRLARWAYRLVPTIAIDTDSALLLDARGCERLYRGMPGLARRLLAPLQRAGIDARLAGAPTFGAAWALARFAVQGLNSPVLIDQQQLAPALDPLPIEALRITPTVTDALHAVGVERIGQLQAIPRVSLGARYGSELLLRLDQAFGRAYELITPLQPRPALQVERMFDGPTDRPHAVALATRGLVERLGELLERKGRGSLSIRVELLRADLDPLVIPLRTSAPCAQARHLWKLLEPSIERAHLGFGVEGVRLTVLRSRPLGDAQGTCWQDHLQRPAEFSELIDTLYARLGPEQVLRAQAIESHLPERAFSFTPLIDSAAPRPSETLDGPPDRPTAVLPDPRPIEVSLLNPDGPLTTLRTLGSTFSVRRSIGPERIAGEWWHSSAGERDYFKVLTQCGRWLWVYRQTMRDTCRWYLHGEWV